MKKLFVIALILALCLPALAGCSDAVIGQLPAAPTAGVEEGQSVQNAPIQSGGVTDIVLNGASASVTGGGAAVDGAVIRINSPGEYSVSGALDGGRIVVDTGEVKGNVTLKLNGAEIRCPDGPAILVEQVKNFYLETEKDSFNRLVSGTEDVLPADKQEGAVLFSEDDVILRGAGELEIRGWLNNGITCKDDLEIESGTITVSAVNNGIKGSESVTVSGGRLFVTAGNDGIKSTSVKKEGKGFVELSGGSVSVVAAGDGVAAESWLKVSGGTVDVTTDGDPETRSCKGLKAGTMLELSGADVTLSCTDHAVHSAADLLVSGGTLRVNSSAGKGLSAHGALDLTGGTLDVVSANDGLSGVRSVSITGGTADIFSREDGVKAGASGAAGSFRLTGGTVTISAYKDVFDAKGGAVITGGSLVGVGTSKNPQNFSRESSQYSLLFVFSGGEGEEAEVSYDEDNALVGLIVGRCGYTYAIYAVPDLVPGSYHLSCGTLSAPASVG